MKSKDIGTMIEKELGYKIQVVIEKERNNVKFLISELRQVVNVPMNEIVPVLSDDDQLKEFLLSKIRSKILN
jgi:hypothetical protein